MVKFGKGGNCPPRHNATDLNYYAIRHQTLCYHKRKLTTIRWPDKRTFRVFQISGHSELYSDLSGVGVQLSIL